MKVAPAMLLKTRSRFRQFATHPVMSMKTSGLLIYPEVAQNERDILKSHPLKTAAPCPACRSYL
jgi:hypothetical protein